MKTCSKCILPEDFPGASLDDEGVCQPCRDYDAGEGPYGWKNADEIKKLADRCESYFEEAKESGSEYDCLVSLSGGKDSAYLANLVMEEYGMHPLLLSIDTGFLSPLAHENIASVVDGLVKKHKGEIEHVFLKNPDIQKTYKKLYRYLFTHPDERGYVHTICYTCAPLMEDIAMDAATSKGIPLVLEGYSPHQPDYDFMFFELPEKKINHHHIPEWMTEENGFSDEDKKWFWNPEKYPSGTKFPKVLAPLHALPYDQETVKQKDVEAGLIPDIEKTDPAETNCLLNWPMIYLDKKGERGFGHIPYIEEFARQVREGIASREYWDSLFKKMNFAMAFGLFKNKEIRHVSKELGINLKKLRRG